MTHKMIMMCAITIAGASLGTSLVGCASTQSHSNNNALSEIDPAIAYSRQRKEQALEHYNTASMLHLDDKTDEALSEYRKALELNDKLYAAWNNMGQLLLTEGNYADAVSAYQIASGLEPSDPRPEYNIGLAYQQVGWAQDSYDHFEKSLARDSNYMPALHGIIRSAEMLGLGDPSIMNHIRNAQLRENDDQWKSYLSTQYYRVQAILDN